MKLYQKLTASRYLKGVCWFMLVSLFSSLNDVFMRYLGTRLPAMEIVFFRFFFAGLLLMPLMIYYRSTSFKTSKPMLHLVRALLGFAAVSLWCYGVSISPLVLATTVALTVPIFVLPMAYFFLHETVGTRVILATFIGFLGIFLILVPNISLAGVLSAGPFVLVVSAILFAASDVVNKVMIKYESMLAMLFYFALGTTVASIFPTIRIWIQPNLYELGLLLALGFGGNAILFFLLKAYKEVDVSALAPYRYLELVFAAIFGYIIFAEIPGVTTILGACIIIPVTLYIALKEA